MKFIDTYSYLLENVTSRQFGLCGSDIEYETADFDPFIYSNERGKVFSCRNEAYKDWLDIGRRCGYAFQHGKDTVLKIILKAKDEPELIEFWIHYHARIVGYHNIVILDCKSVDPEYIRILNSYRNKVLVLDYPKYYNEIHSPGQNPGFYKLICASCRYLTVMDADEFLVGFSEGIFSGNAVKRILKDSLAPIFGATWINNLDPADVERSHLGWTSKISLDASLSSLEAGSIAGKAIVSSSAASTLSHIGHNLHVPDVTSMMTEHSFGQIFIIHLKNLNSHTVRRRWIKHLRAKGVLPASITNQEEIDEFIFRISDALETFPVDAQYYIKSYTNKVGGPRRDFAVKTSLLSGIENEENEALAQAISKVNFQHLIDRQLAALRVEV